MLGDQKSTFTYSKGDVIFSEGEALNGMYSIHYGAVKEVVSTGQDIQQIVSLSSAGMLIGFRALGGTQSNYVTTAIALDDVELVYFPIHLFNIAMNANPIMLESLLKLCIDDLNRSERKSRFLLNASAEERVLSVLDYLVKVFSFADDVQHKLSFTPSRKDMVSLSGLSYETFTRALMELKRRGIVELDQKELIIHRHLW